MENVLKAPKRARVKAVKVKPGDVLAVDEVMLKFEAVGRREQGTQPSPS